MGVYLLLCWRAQLTHPDLPHHALRLLHIIPNYKWAYYFSPVELYSWLLMKITTFKKNLWGWVCSKCKIPSLKALYDQFQILRYYVNDQNIPLKLRSYLFKDFLETYHFFHMPTCSLALQIFLSIWKTKPFKGTVWPLVWAHWKKRSMLFFVSFFTKKS